MQQVFIKLKDRFVPLLSLHFPSNRYFFLFCLCSSVRKTSFFFSSLYLIYKMVPQHTCNEQKTRLCKLCITTCVRVIYLCNASANVCALGYAKEGC